MVSRNDRNENAAEISIGGELAEGGDSRKGITARVKTFVARNTRSIPSTMWKTGGADESVGRMSDLNIDERISVLGTLGRVGGTRDSTEWKRWEKATRSK
jgi:hypothetical protein